MRDWEFVLLMMQTVIAIMANRSSTLLRILCLLLPVPLIVHLIVEGYRWQMVPAYLFVLWAFSKAALRIVKGTSSRSVATGPRRLRWTLGVGLLLISWMIPYLLPVPSLETPSGDNPVGTIVYHWTDRNRVEQTPGKTDRYRELNVQIWYPAQTKSGMKQAPYIPELSALSRYAEQKWHIPSFVLDYLRLARTHTYLASGLSNSQSKYPIIILSHGWPGFSFAYHYLVTGLASRGYVVVAIEHTYGTPAAAFPDGSVETMGPSPSEFDLPAWDRIIEDVWSEDDKFVLNQLGKLDANDPEGQFTHRLNLEQAGVIGHSFGGDNALAALRKDKRFKAGISMDGSFYGDDKTPLSAEQSFLWMCTDKYVNRMGLPEPSSKQLSDAGMSKVTYDRWVADFHRRRTQAMAEGGQVLQLHGASHTSFSDKYLYSPITQWAAKAPNPHQSHRTILKYVVAFFDEHLKRDAPGLLEQEARQDDRVLLNPPILR
ncbi:alpha/beta hydrolase family protein [Cohnella soli]|uniref:Alpha/beta hydrolase family protein n=1 Tax=Cohnella soli TaxID=425005 RepID=A0ABW0I1N4_9BACL